MRGGGWGGLGRYVFVRRAAITAMRYPKYRAMPTARTVPTSVGLDGPAPRRISVGVVPGALKRIRIVIVPATCLAIWLGNSWPVAKILTKHYNAPDN